MYGNPQRRTSSEVQQLRRAGGLWLKHLRERAGILSEAALGSGWG